MIGILLAAIIELVPGVVTTTPGGIGAKSPSDKYLAPGAKVWFTGTAKGRVWIYVE